MGYTLGSWPRVARAPRVPLASAIVALGRASRRDTTGRRPHCGGYLFVPIELALVALF